MRYTIVFSCQKNGESWHVSATDYVATSLDIKRGKGSSFKVIANHDPFLNGLKKESSDKRMERSPLENSEIAHP